MEVIVCRQGDLHTCLIRKENLLREDPLVGPMTIVESTLKNTRGSLVFIPVHIADDYVQGLLCR